jgi:hypothetical protein
LREDSVMRISVAFVVISIIALSSDSRADEVGTAIHGSIHLADGNKWAHANDVTESCSIGLLDGGR